MLLYPESTGKPILNFKTVIHKCTFGSQHLANWGCSGLADWGCSIQPSLPISCVLAPASPMNMGKDAMWSGQEESE